MPASPTIDAESLAGLFAGRCECPSRVLGPQPPEPDARGRHAVRRVRTFLPRARQVWLVRRGEETDESRPMRRTHAAGLYEAVVPAGDGVRESDYVFRYVDASGVRRDMHDPYAFGAQTAKLTPWTPSRLPSWPPSFS